MNKIEILAPAGSISRMKAAFSAGADACYIGGNKFGARAFAENPSEEELVEAIYYAHFHRKKLFLTVNTLLKEKELQGELFEYILPYYEAGIDAVIVQDFGVMKFLAKQFPKLPLHASTQMTLCDYTAASFLASYPVERLVLARELSLNEIAGFKETGLEIECFVHGALCVCYSGQCSMSYFNGGRSGNRGSCAGPCRMDYNLYGDEKGKRQKIEGEPYLLSPKDICSIDYIPEMAEAGVYSFKIEGRMKRPEYAALTSHLYRKWADYYLLNGKEAFKSKEAVKERKKDIIKLSDLYNRGSFTSGYLFMHNGKEMMADKRPNHNGVLAARVTKVGSPKKKNILELEALINLHPQDVLEVRNEKNFQPIYEFTLKDGYSIKERFSSNFTPGLKIKEGMKIYRTKNDVLLKEILHDWVEVGIKQEISAMLVAKAGERLALTFTSDSTGLSSTVYGEVVSEALTKPVEKERIEKALMKLGDTDFSLTKENIIIQMDEKVFVPMSLLNDSRREVSRALYELMIKQGMRSPVVRNERLNLTEKKQREMIYQIMVMTPEQIDYLLNDITLDPVKVEFVFNLDLFPRGRLHFFVSEASKKGFSVYLRLPEIFRREMFLHYKRFFDSENGKMILECLSGFLIRNLESLTFVKNLNQAGEYSHKIETDTNLHVFNSEAADCLFEFGISSYTVSPEHRFQDAIDTASNLRSSILPAFILYGREELMVTSQCQWKNKNRCVKELNAGEEPLPAILFLENRKYKTAGSSSFFPVMKNCESCMNYIFMDKPLQFFAEKEFLKALNPAKGRIAFTFENKKEIREVLKLAKLSQ